MTVRPRFLYFCFPLFVGSFLLFQIQLILAKALLPSFGGSPAVWSGAMVFFQSALLVGYLIADRLSRFREARLTNALYCALMFAAALTIDILPAPLPQSDIAGAPLGSLL